MQVELTSDDNPKVELKLDGVPQKTNQLGSSFNISSGKDGTSAAPEDTTLIIKMADDEAEVRGFGKPITHPLAGDIALQYIKTSDLAWVLLTSIEDGSINTVEAIKNDAGYTALRKMLNPKNQIVSGVFGKEAILQMLAQKDCEGIRYTIGEMAVKVLNEQRQEEICIQTTVVLTPVKDVTPKGSVKAISEPLAGWQAYSNKKEKDIPTPPPDTEVHLSSLTRHELFELLKKREDQNIAHPYVQVLFGQY